MHEFIVGTLRDGERFGTPEDNSFAFGPPTRKVRTLPLRGSRACDALRELDSNRLTARPVAPAPAFLRG